MQLRVYVETSVISYLIARDSKNPVILVRQQSTREWWNTERNQYELFVSDLVHEEAGRGDEDNALARLKAIEDFAVLPVNVEAKNLAALLLKLNAVPMNAAEDAAHIAIATVHSMRFLLTWNFRHINNVSKQRLIESVCYSEGFVCPVICSPNDLMEAGNED